MNVRNNIHAMTEDPANKERLYVTNEDIVGLATINSDTVFAVTAPQGTSLVVPDPESDVEMGQPRNYRWAHHYPSATASKCKPPQHHCRIQGPACLPHVSWQA